MIEHMLEYIGNLPPLAQFILIALALSGTPTGLIAGVFAVWKMREAAAANREAVKQTERLEAVENQQIKAESDAATTKAQLEILRETVAGTFENQKAWQEVVNTMSNRRHEDHVELITTLRELRASNVNQTEMAEIQAEQLGQLDNTVQKVGNRVESGVQTMEQIARDNRTDLTTALGLNVTATAAHESTLQVIRQEFRDLRNDVNSVLRQGHELKSQAIQVIDARLSSMEKTLISILSDTPAPRSTSVETLLDDTSIVSSDTTPQVETTNQP